MRLNLDIRNDEAGLPKLYFPFMSISDIHWGTAQSRAKRLCQALESTQTNHLQLPGDIVDLEYLRRKPTWNLGPWHREGMGHIFRKADHGTRVVFNPGNHEGTETSGHTPERLMDKSVYGVEFERNTVYEDPLGRKILISHGHEHDADIIKSREQRAFLYRTGDLALAGMYLLDHGYRKIDPDTDFSFAASGKHLVKNFINSCLGVRANIHRKIDQSGYDGYIYGHTHMGGFEHTPGGKMIINDGTCTEHVQFVVHDAAGNWALIKFHKDRMTVTEPCEDGKEVENEIYWKDLGLDHFGDEPVAHNDEYTYRADRFSRIIARSAPALDQQQARLKKREAEELLRYQSPENIIEQFQIIAAIENPLLKNPVPKPERLSEAAEAEQIEAAPALALNEAA